MEQKIKQKGINIGGNIRQIRKMKNIGQTELARMVQLNDVYMTREMLVKIERGIQHITGAQLKGIRDCLNTTYDELLKEVHS
jgi:Helix-turn-helix.